MDVHPVAFITYAMTIAAGTMLTFTGAGPHWRRIVRHPLSFGVGGGIIAMESVYYVMVCYLTPADASLLVRLNIPIAAVLGLMLVGRRVSPTGLAGHAVVLAAILWYLPAIDAEHRWTGFALGAACGLIMSLRAFATEFHPWNQRARTITEKVRLTGLVLLVTSLAGDLIVAGLMLLVAEGRIAQPGWLPELRHFLHVPTIALGLFMGACVLTVIQYLAFSAVIKVRAENFVAMTAIIPLVTVAFQLLAISLGILAPVPLDWSVVGAMLVVFAGVLVLISASERAHRGG